MKPIFLLAENLQHIRNWARAHQIDLLRHSNIRWARDERAIEGMPRGGYFATVSWPRNGGDLTSLLQHRGYERLPEDINEWPLDLFA